MGVRVLGRARCGRPWPSASRPVEPACGPARQVGAGTFFAQACATGFVGRAATSERGAASGLYLASYFFGGLVGSAVLGPIFDMFGWKPCVAGIAVALVIAALLAIFLKTPMAPGPMGRAGAH